MQFNDKKLIMAGSAASSTEILPKSSFNRTSTISNNSTTKQSIPKSARRFIAQIRWSALFGNPLSSSASSQCTPTPPPKSPVQLFALEHSRTNKNSNHTPLIFVPRHTDHLANGSPLSPPIPYSSRIADSFPPLTSSAPKIRHVEIRIPDWVNARYTPESPLSVQQSSSGGDSDSIFSRTRDSASTRHSEAFSLECLFQSNQARIEPAIPASCANTTASTSRAITPSVFPTPPAMATPHIHPGQYRLNESDTPEENSQLRYPVSALPNRQPTEPASVTLQGIGPSQTSNLDSKSNSSSNSGLSGFVCNVHKTTGQKPKPLVGATTTIIGDKLYVFGGRRISRTTSRFTSKLYELDLIQRHWSKIECKGDIPSPRYFHSVCPLGDTKLVCYGGLSQPSQPLTNGHPNDQPGANESPNPMEVHSDITIFDIPTRTWRKINSVSRPQGRYAHCASILPSSAVFTSPRATMSAIQHNPSSANTPDQGKLGVALDGTGGAELVVVGGQDPSTENPPNQYIEEISVFNLRSLTWTSTNSLDRQCGVYRTVTAPLGATLATQMGMGTSSTPNDVAAKADGPPDAGSAMLIYSNYNFLDVKLELQLLLPDGTLIDKAMQGRHSPPGLRFPNGGIIHNHFVVSGTLLTEYKEEYALWALDLRTLLWSRMDIGSSTFSQGSWNRGMIWNRRNSFVILGDKTRSLVDDYNHRRINFSNLCVVELEAFGLYDNPRRLNPMSGYVSASAPSLLPATRIGTDVVATSRQEFSDRFGSGREVSQAAQDLGLLALNSPELADMDFLAIDGERIPANSRIVARRWGPYFTTLLREALITSETDAATLRPSAKAQSISASARSNGNDTLGTIDTMLNSEAPENTINQSNRPRTFYLPHTSFTIQALLHYLYTSSLPPTTSNLYTPQVLCSVLQIARPYKVDGLLEAVVERLHSVLDNRNTAAIFNAAAMAAGGGEGIEFVEDVNRASLQAAKQRAARLGRSESPLLGEHKAKGVRTSNEQVNKIKPHEATAPPSPDTDSSGSDGEGEAIAQEDEEIWSGTLSSVIGLQKRGLRGLMEGRRIREMGNTMTGRESNESELNEQVGLGIEKT